MFTKHTHGLLVAFLFLGLVAIPAAAEEGGDSPEDVAKKLKVVSDSGEMGGMIPLLHPDERAKFAFVMSLGGAMAAGFSDNAEEATKEYEALNKKHGVKEEKEGEGAPLASEEEMAMAARKMFDGVDLEAYTNDLFAFMKKYMKEQPKGGPVPSGELTDLKIEGDTATAMVGEDKVKFGKVDGRWYIYLDM